MLKVKSWIYISHQLKKLKKKAAELKWKRTSKFVNAKKCTHIRHSRKRQITHWFMVKPHTSATYGGHTSAYQ